MWDGYRSHSEKAYRASEFERPYCAPSRHRIHLRSRVSRDDPGDAGQGLLKHSCSPQRGDDPSPGKAVPTRCFISGATAKASGDRVAR